MKTKKVIRRSRRFSEPFRITEGGNFRLKDIDPGDTLGLEPEDKPRAKEALAIDVEALADLQDRLYAQDRWAVLLIFQSMDAAGKDGAIRYLMSGLNPQKCRVFSFKTPSIEELNHDYLWRCARCLPERGRIGIFNRSYYEETLGVRVHPELLEKQKLPGELVSDKIWKRRFKDIRNFERYLTRNGTIIRKFFLHLSKDEQTRRFCARIEDQYTHWESPANDVRVRRHWKDYMNAYEEAIRRTATEYAPWYVVPADNKWFTRMVVAAAVIEALAPLDIAYSVSGKPKLDEPEAAGQAAIGSGVEEAGEPCAFTG